MRFRPVREMEDNDFETFLLICGDLGCFSLDLENQKTHLTFVTYMMDDMEP